MACPPDSSSAYVAHSLEELLDAIVDALELTRSGQLDERVATSLRYANALLDLVQETVGDLQADRDSVSAARARMDAAGAWFVASRTMH